MKNNTIMTTHSQTARQRKQSINLALQRFFMKMHVFLYRSTGGAISGKMAGRTMLLLTTRGRKSGQERITPIQYNMDGNNFILIASNGGSEKHPQWFLNLQAHPQSKVQVGRRIIAVTASEAQGEERQRIWSLVTVHSSEFDNYQQRIKREIPVVVLTPHN